MAVKTTEFASQLRALLLDLGFSVEELVRVGAHSLKVTCLTWAAKFGVEREQRRLLGYHLAPGDRTLEAYSRDSMATPLAYWTRSCGTSRTASLILTLRGQEPLLA